ncbi:MAG TPA: type I glyceraldehyde-3-phosphate dehydrogenase [Acidimicrobiales bacterium]|nr:type I glyceraldehyde-3-phosphate dehydrogenase [Acidimicrobiales bacterium]
MAIRVGVNGFGRIGRNFFRAAQNSGQMEVVGINDLVPPDTNAHLLKYDTTYGTLKESVEVTDDGISVDGREIKVFAERDPKAIPWSDLDVDLVVESTGIFTDGPSASAHIDAGAPYVMISAPAKEVSKTFVYGVNHEDFDPEEDKVTSNASCTTNCFVPMVKVLDDAFGIEKGLMTTAHAYTNDQSLQDFAHKDLRRARSAPNNIIPASTGAARATSEVLKHMEGKLDGTALRVPVPCGSITDFTAVLEKETSVEEVNEAFKAAASDGPLAEILEYSEDPIVSSDIVGSQASCTFDSDLTFVNGSLVKVLGWYDNEWGYSCRLVDMGLIIGAANQK